MEDINVNMPRLLCYPLIIKSKLTLRAATVLDVKAVVGGEYALCYEHLSIFALFPIRRRDHSPIPPGRADRLGLTKFHRDHRRHPPGNAGEPGPP